MFGFLRRKKDKAKQTSETDAEQTGELAPEATTSEAPAPEPAITETPIAKSPAAESPANAVDTIAEAAAADTTESKKGMFSRLRDRLSKTRGSLTDGMADLLLGKKTIDNDLLEELETRLLSADVGIEATTRIIDDLTRRVSRKELGDPEALFNALCEDMVDILQPVEQPLQIDTQKRPYVILVVGINGAGKTTTIGKLAKRFQNQGQSVMLAAGDTFRAAAVEQLQTWGERNHIPVIAQGTGADSASVIFDGVQAAMARGVDVLIADTAGRLHTKSNLMEELSKVVRVMKKLIPDAPHEVLLVLDAGTGQNAINQAEEFRDTAGVTGLVLTKLDGTAKGGILFALAKRTGLPIRFIGVGEQLEDLRPFNAEEFVQALFEDVAR